jgi:hypothetical protein
MQAFPPGSPTTTLNIIPAYAYVQYQDDDAVQAFFSAYNEYTQSYLNYLNNLNLPIYTRSFISGSLLDWVANGIYGFVRPVFSVAGTEGKGPLNTWPLNTIPLNTDIAGKASSFTYANDDIFKRVLTWHLYKGDGEVFNAQWLKRRVNRFLNGINGTDPVVNPYTVSVELTGPYAATINVPASNPTSAIFSQAVSQGVLELPFQITWTVTSS